ncbi:hypothetical protein AALC17_02835 [Oscillospiraceae bacterium 38-13]
MLFADLSSLMTPRLLSANLGGKHGFVLPMRRFFMSIAVLAASSHVHKEKNTPMAAFAIGVLFISGAIQSARIPAFVRILCPAMLLLMLCLLAPSYFSLPGQNRGASGICIGLTGILCLRIIKPGMFYRRMPGQSKVYFQLIHQLHNFRGQLFPLLVCDVDIQGIGPAMIMLAEYNKFPWDIEADKITLAAPFELRKVKHMLNWVPQMPLPSVRPISIQDSVQHKI